MVWAIFMRNQPNRSLASFKALTRAIVWVLLGAVLLVPWFPASAGAASKIFQPLRADLLAQGFGAAQVDRLLSSPKLKFEASMMARMLSVPESKLNYQQFLTKKSITKGRRFMKKHAAVLAQAQRNTKVPASLVVAILLVESRLGSYTGKSKVVNMLASQAVLDTPTAQAQLARRWPKKRRGQLSKPKTQQRLERRAKWARKELGALLRLAEKEKTSPWDYKGSPAGALGMAQFVPSSILKYGVDGNNDGRINLHLSVDAIHSVANYLQKNGWRPGLSPNQRTKVILTYNRSTPYANTVLELARRLS